MPSPKYSDNLGEALMYLYGVGILGLLTVVSLINTPGLLLGVLGGAMAGATLGETMVYSGMKFFNLPKHIDVDVKEDNSIGEPAIPLS